MTNTGLLQSTHKKEDNEGSGSIDFNFISRMPDDVLVLILSRMPIKDAVVTSSLSKRWRPLWRNVTRLNFDGTETLEKVGNDEMLFALEVFKFIYQVYNVNTYYNHQRVHVFAIRFDLDRRFSGFIDQWIKFALEKKVETLDLDLMDKNYDVREPDERYEFRIPSSNAMVVETFNLKKLFLKAVNMDEPTLNKILKNSPHLEKIEMFGTDLSPHIHIGGQDVKLKHFELVSCSGVESMSLHGFGLVSFIYYGPEIELHLSDLPKLEQLDIGEASVGLENNVFRQISPCALHLQSLVLDIRSPKRGLDVKSIIRFPNVKKLMLAMDAEEDDCLLRFTSIAQACPSLETFTVALHWFTPTKRRRKVRRVVAPNPHENLKQFEIIGYYGRISDLELAVYVIENASSLKKIVIDVCCHAFGGNLSKQDCLNKQPAARFSAQREITPLLPPGVDLAIL